MNTRILLAVLSCLLLSSCNSYLYREYDSFIWIVILVIIVGFVVIRWTRATPEDARSSIYQRKHFHFEDFQLSSQDFYEVLKGIIEERAFPNVSASVVSLSEGGWLQGKRKYLEVKYADFLFYVCAAPFGKNFFISYWLREVPPGCEEVFTVRVFGTRTKKSFYQLDTEAMFFEGISAAIMKAIAEVTEARGLRVLRPDELIPKSF